MRRSLTCLFTASLLFGAAPAAWSQTMYRCTDANGRTVFSDKPCPGGGGSVVDTKPATGSRSSAPPAAEPAAAPVPARPAPAGNDNATASPPPAAPGRGVAPGVGYGTREQACSNGNARACDEIACLRDERDACNRIGGLRGSGWYEMSRHTETQRGQNDLGKTTLARVLVITLRCTGNPPRGGDVLLNRGSIKLRSGNTQYSSIDTAAAALCKR